MNIYISPCNSCNTAYSTNKPMFASYGVVYQIEKKVVEINFFKKNYLVFGQYFDDLVLKNGSEIFNLNGFEIKSTYIAEPVKDKAIKFKRNDLAYLKYNEIEIEIPVSNYLIYSSPKVTLIKNKNVLEFYNNLLHKIDEIHFNSISTLQFGDNVLIFDAESKSLSYIVFKNSKYTIKYYEIDIDINRFAAFEFCGELNGEFIINFYGKLIGVNDSSLNILFEERVIKSAKSKGDLFYVIFKNDSKLYVYDKGLKNIYSSIKLPKSTDFFINFESNGVDNIARFCSSHNYSNEYFVTWSDLEFLEGNEISIMYEKSKASLKVIENDSLYDIEVNCDKNATVSEFFRHAFSAFDEVVWSLCIESNKSEYLGYKHEAFSGLCIINMEKELFSEDEIEKALDILKQMNRNMFRQRIRGTEVLPRMKFQLI